MEEIFTLFNISNFCCSFNNPRKFANCIFINQLFYKLSRTLKGLSQNLSNVHLINAFSTVLGILNHDVKAIKDDF